MVRDPSQSGNTNPENAPAHIMFCEPEPATHCHGHVRDLSVLHDENRAASFPLRMLLRLLLRLLLLTPTPIQRLRVDGFQLSSRRLSFES